MIHLPMIRLPLAARELTRLGRQGRMYLLRTAVITTAFLILLGLAIESRGWYGRPENIGLAIRGIITAFQFFAVFLVIPGLTGSLIADERRDGSLGLLMIADYGGLDIFVAKFITAFVEVQMLLLATLPLLAFGALFGGIPIDAMIKQWLVLSLCAFSMCCVGLLMSSFVRHAVSAIILNVAVVAAILLSYFILTEFFIWNFRKPFPDIHPVGAIVYTLFNGESLRHWWAGFLAIFLIGIAAASWTLLWLPYAAVTGPRRRWFGPSTPYGATHRRLLRQSPAAPFIACHSAGFLSTLQSNTSRRTLAILMAGIALVPVFGGMAVLFLLCYDITLSLTSMRREGALDDLVVTRIGEKRLARDIFRYHVTRASVYFPAFVVVAAQLGFLMIVVLDWNIVTRFGMTQYWRLIGDLPSGVEFAFQLFLLASVVMLMLVQGPAIVAISCAAGIRHATRIPPWARAVLGILAIYAIVVTLIMGVQYQLLYFEFFLRHVWFPGVFVAVCSNLLFIVAGSLAYRELGRTITEDTRPVETKVKSKGGRSVPA